MAQRGGVVSDSDITDERGTSSITAKDIQDLLMRSLQAYNAGHFEAACAIYAPEAWVTFQDFVVHGRQKLIEACLKEYPARTGMGAYEACTLLAAYGMPQETVGNRSRVLAVLRYKMRSDGQEKPEESLASMVFERIGEEILITKSLLV
jgi:hypothetical protein